MRAAILELKKVPNRMWFVGLLLATAYRPCAHASFARDDARALLKRRLSTEPAHLVAHSYASSIIDGGGFAVVSEDRHVFVLSDNNTLNVALWSPVTSLHAKVDAVTDLLQWFRLNLHTVPNASRVLCVQ